jgi:hypothetical protein
MEQYQWDLTDEERAQLKDRDVRRRGQLRLLEQIQRVEGYEVEKESAWWESVCLRLGIPPDKRHNLIADPTNGKVWVRGQVSELDKKLSQLQDM